MPALDCHSLYEDGRMNEDAAVVPPRPLKEWNCFFLLWVS